MSETRKIDDLRENNARQQESQLFDPWRQEFEAQSKKNDFLQFLESPAQSEF